MLTKLFVFGELCLGLAFNLGWFVLIRLPVFVELCVWHLL